MTWGSRQLRACRQGGLVLGSAIDDDTLRLPEDPINLSSGTRTIVVNSGFATIDARLSGALTNGGLTVTGSGVLDLAASNGYTGQTIVNGAVLRLSNSAALPGGTGSSGGLSNLLLEGSGVLELNAGNFTRGFWHQRRQRSSGEAEAAASAAGSGTRTVNLGGSGLPVTWNSSVFVGNGQPLVFGSKSDGGTVVFQNPLSLGMFGQGQTILVNSGSASLDAQLTGTISGGVGNGGLTITGGGAIEFTAANSYSGPTILAAGVLRMSNTGALSSGNLQLGGGVLELNAGNFARTLVGQRCRASAMVGQFRRRIQRRRRHPLRDLKRGRATLLGRHVGLRPGHWQRQLHP